MSGLSVTQQSKRARDEDAERVLSRTVHEASAGLPSNHSWGQRRAASGVIRSCLSPRVDRFETARIESGTHLRVRYNHTAAAAWATANCPRGDGRRFGACRAEDAVVLQNRVGEATPLAVAFDVVVTRERGTTEVTVVCTVW